MADRLLQTSKNPIDGRYKLVPTANNGVVVTDQFGNLKTEKILPTPIQENIVVEDLKFSDSNKKNASTSKHGLLPKLSGDPTQYLDGEGNFTVPAGGGIVDLSTTLGLGNTTGGTDIEVSAGDKIIIDDATASKIAAIGASKEITFLDTATYPSLAELAYVKGVTSAIQGQINALPTPSSTTTLTNKRITKRVVTVSDATSITPNTDNADMIYQVNTQALGTLTINADAGTPTEGQSLLIIIKSTNVQTFSWNAQFVGGTTALPTATSGATKRDKYAFMYSTVSSKWEYSGSALGYT